MGTPNYKVQWVGIVEGYGITETEDEVDEYEVFNTYREAKNNAVEKAKSDVEGAKRGLDRTRAIRKRDV